MNLIEYRKVSQAFRRISSDMLRSKSEDGNKYLMRFRKFIQENEQIRKILEDEIQGIDYDYKEGFIVKESGWSEISIPIDEKEHIKAMYDYLIDITNEEEDIRW